MHKESQTIRDSGLPLWLEQLQGKLFAKCSSWRCIQKWWSLRATSTAWFSHFPFLPFLNIEDWWWKILLQQIDFSSPFFLIFSQFPITSPQSLTERGDRRVSLSSFSRRLPACRRLPQDVPVVAAVPTAVPASCSDGRRRARTLPAVWYLRFIRSVHDFNRSVPDQLTVSIGFTNTSINWPY